MDTTCRAILIPVGGVPEVIELKDSVTDLQEVVGGYFEVVGRFRLSGTRTATAWGDEDGIAKRLPLNRVVDTETRSGSVVGPIVITVSDEDGETYSLTDAEITICLVEIARWSTVKDWRL